MKLRLLTLTTLITITAALISLYLVTLSNPTDAQRTLRDTAKEIAIAGASTILGFYLNMRNAPQDRLPPVTSETVSNHKKL